MSSVLVRRCVLRIRRTAGWAWGDSPDALLASASRALPQLLAARLPQLADASERPLHLTAPIRLRVEATLAELAALGGHAPPGGPSTGALQLEQRIAAAVERALADAVAAAGGSEPAVAAANTPARPTAEPDAAAVARSTGTPERARRALRAWYLGAKLEAVLAELDDSALAALHDSVFELEARAPLPAAQRASSELAAASASASASPAAPASLRARLAAAGALLGHEADIATRELRAGVDRALPAAAQSRFAAPAARAAQRASSQGELAAAAMRDEVPAVLAKDAAPAEAPSPAPVTLRTGAELELRSALPFLLLPSLHHAGWLDAAAALLRAHELEDAAFALAAALAAKVASPPERGWMRSVEDRRVISVFAGRDELLDEQRTLAAAARLAPILAPLDAALQSALSRGRAAATPLVLLRSDRGFLLLDAADLTVLGVSASAPRPPEGSLVLVPAACADAATLESIDLANARFVTDAPPGRGEPYRRLSGASRPLWTNDTATPAAQLLARSADFDDVVAHAAELAEALSVRPAIARAPLGALESTATLATTAALSDLGARIFPHERTSPMLALLRFADLDARVRVDRDCVRVRVPLGRRHADLMRHGFLATLDGVPWLDGRTLDIGGG